VTYPSSPDVLSEKFTSKERDAETGLDYFGFRYFSSAQGRWTGPDQPFADQHNEDPQSWNMYAYVRNNPLIHVDPNGKQSCAMVGNPCGYLPTGPPTGKNIAIAAGIIAAPAAIAGAPEIGAGAGLLGTLRAAGSAALAWILGHPQQVQDAAAGIAEGLSGAAPGSLSSASTLSTFGFTKVEGAIEGFTYGRLANGAQVAAQFTKAGENVTAAVLGAFNADAKETAGSIIAIMKGAQAVAKSEGATSLTIQAVGVVNPKLAALLANQGFKETTIKVAGEEVKAFVRTFEVR
jgi:RHS repeat-associated protein